jgi:hypothetical protein
VTLRSTPTGLRAGLPRFAHNDTLKPNRAHPTHPEEIPCSRFITSTTPARSEFCGCWRSWARPMR